MATKTFVLACLHNSLSVLSCFFLADCLDYPVVFFNCRLQARLSLLAAVPDAVENHHPRLYPLTVASEKHIYLLLRHNAHFH